jgi:hypothetical protein
MHPPRSKHALLAERGLQGMQQREFAADYADTSIAIKDLMMLLARN